MGAMLNNRSLKVLREQRRLNITDVADVASISPRSLEKFEGGDSRPSRKQLERLAQIYGVPLYSLFGEKIPNTEETPRDFRNRAPEPASLSPRGLTALWASEKIS